MSHYLQHRYVPLVGVVGLLALGEVGPGPLEAPEVGLDVLDVGRYPRFPGILLKHLLGPDGRLGQVLAAKGRTSGRKLDYHGSK